MTVSEKRVTRHLDGKRRFVTRRIGSETIIVPVAGRVGDLESVYTLNEIATRIWELLDSPHSAAEIAKRLAADYDTSERQLAADVAEFLEVLATRGLVRVTADSVC